MRSIIDSDRVIRIADIPAGDHFRITKDDIDHHVRIADDSPFLQTDQRVNSVYSLYKGRIVQNSRDTTGFIIDVRQI